MDDLHCPSMKYQPGNEPEELKKYLYFLIKEFDQTFPDHCIIMEQWNHERWDKVAGYLVKQLGYFNGRSFLESYGYKVFLTAEEYRVNNQPVSNNKPFSSFSLDDIKSYSSEPEYSQCLKCGKKILAGEELCDECYEAQQSKKKMKRFILLSVVVIAVILFILIAGVLFAKRYSDSRAYGSLNSATDAEAFNDTVTVLEDNASSFDDSAVPASSSEGMLLLVSDKDPEAVIASGDAGDQVTWELNNSGIITFSGDGVMMDIALVPGDGSFEFTMPWKTYSDGIREVVFEDGITHIGAYSFFMLYTNIEKVSIPSSVTSIGDGAFCGCDQLKSITIPNSSATIGNQAFNDSTQVNIG